MPKRVRWRYLVSIAVVLIGSASLAADRWLRSTTIASIPAVSVPPGRLFAEPVRLAITVSAAGQRAPWVATEEDLRGNVELWKRMHLEDWDGVPLPIRTAGLDRMLERFGGLLHSPAAWDQMTVFDWDAVPQPIRTVAYRRMVAYWSGYYHVGAGFGLPAGAMAETLAAIVMSESWFDHRARSVNRDGTVDIGLAQASPFARERLRALHAAGRVDALLGEDDYDNPWMATRFVALWMALMLEENNGDLDQAVRAYNRGTADAADRLGADYLAAVQRRLHVYIRSAGAPPSWQHVWRRARQQLRRSPA